jgi:hypothetical protein
MHHQTLSLSPRPAEFVARCLTVARHIFLAEGDSPGLVRFLSLPITLADGAKTSWVTVTRTGTFTDPRYGSFDITPAMLAQMVSNFESRVLGQDVFFDVAHKPSDGAACKVLRLAVDNGRLRALVEWTDFGIDAVKKRGFSYLSAEYHEDWRDNERGNPHGCVLLGAGLTTRPVVKHLDPVQLSHDGAADPDDTAKTAIHPSLLKNLTEFDTMNKHLQTLRLKLLALGLTEAQIKPILDAALKQLEAANADEAKCLALVDTFNAAGEALHAQLKTLAAAGGAAPQVINLQVGNGLDATAVQTEVARVLALQATAAAEASAALAGKVKLLSDTVGSATTLSDDVKAAMVAELQPLVTKELSDDQVKRLAEFAIGKFNQVSAAQQLATLGYRPASGSVHITVDSTNQVKALQEQVDRRLGIVGMPDAQRYARTGGMLLAANKGFAEKALAHFDTMHGARLANEHKMLAAGSGNSGDVGVPAIFERTVLREALYQMVGLAFVDVGTVDFAPVVQVPYSYRDTTAAGTSQARTYEGGSIPRAGIIQTFEEARPIPQKLAFKLTNEMRYLLGSGAIDFDPLAENTRNVIRIVGEDTDSVIQNEVLRSSDEALSATITDTLTAQVNGTNKIFVLTQFPVVRPRRVYDLKGVQQGSTLQGITVTLNATARTEYVSGTTLASGLYWVMDYNMGEIRFVNELGVLQTPTNGWVLTVAYTYTLNASKVNIDVQASPDTIGLVYDRVLNFIGARKVVVENDRYYTANLLLMSGAVDNALGQATTFTANGARPGSGLNADGSVGMVKGIPAFNTRAPGLNTGDVRIVVGERANTRFRMMRPFSMNNLEEARDNNGLFVGAKENYGEQFIVCHTPTQRKNANTSLVLYSATARVARAA